MKEIITNKITLVDSSGKARIILDADMQSGLARIEIIADEERFLIQSSIDGKVFLSIDRVPVMGVMQIGSNGVIFLNSKS